MTYRAAHHESVDGQIASGRVKEWALGADGPVCSRKGGYMTVALQVESLLEAMRRSVDMTSMDDQRLILALERRVRSDERWKSLSLNERTELVQRAYSSIRGYDVLEEWLQDPEVTEIMVNRFDQIFVESNGVIEQTEQRFASEQKYRDIVQKIVNDAGKEVHQRTPIADCRMHDGSRVNVVLNPIAEGDIALTIRRFRQHIFTLDELVENGTLSSEVSIFLKQCVQARLNIFISGGTGSGKTTLLNALANEIQKTERLITIEDARELNFENMENWVALEARRPSATGEGAITIRDLIRTSLRMRPDRIIVGEVRGPEALDAIQAMNTGHDGSFSTGHANSIADMQLRLETMILSGHEGIPLEAIRQQIGSAIDLFIHVSRLRDHRRYVVSIQEPVLADRTIAYHTIFERNMDEQNIGELSCRTAEMFRKEKFVRAGIPLRLPDVEDERREGSE